MIAHLGATDSGHLAGAIDSAAHLSCATNRGGFVKMVVPLVPACPFGRDSSRVEKRGA